MTAEKLFNGANSLRAEMPPSHPVLRNRNCPFAANLRYLRSRIDYGP